MGRVSNHCLWISVIDYLVCFHIFDVVKAGVWRDERTVGRSRVGRSETMKAGRRLVFGVSICFAEHEILKTGRRLVLSICFAEHLERWTTLIVKRAAFVKDVSSSHTVDDGCEEGWKWLSHHKVACEAEPRGPQSEGRLKVHHRK